MKFGFENEFFLKKDGQLVPVPDTRIPMDAAGLLAEVRSDPFENPFQTLASYNLKLAELETLVAQFNCTLENLREATIGTWNETAGFHIHFSNEAWGAKPGWSHYVQPPPPVVVDMMVKLDARCEKYFKDIRRPPDKWRAQPHGWEYRRLPATVDPITVASICAELFYDEVKKAA